MDGNEILKLQKEAASCTDELLDISNAISEQVLPLYTGTDRSVFELQCRFQIARCDQLSEKLVRIRRELDEVLSQVDAEGLLTADRRAAGETLDQRGTQICTQAEAERYSSGRITLQIIAQNLAIADSKRILLRELLNGSREAQSAVKAAEKLQDSAQIVQLGNTLRELLQTGRTS